MRTESRVFGVITLTLYLFAGVYAFWSWYESPVNQIEVIGSIALLLAGSLCGMCWGFFAFVARRIDLRPEDRGDGEIADAAGDVGFFSPGSYWPFGLAASTTLTGIGVVYWWGWLIALGFISIILTACGLLFEYHTGSRRLGPQ